MDSDDLLKAELQKVLSECQRLREENAQLRLRIDQGRDSVPLDTQQPSEPTNNHPPNLPSPSRLTPTSLSQSPAPQSPSLTPSSLAPTPPSLSNDSRPEAKVSFFRSLFRGRDDVYAVKWEGKNGRTGYSPAGVREWDQSPSHRQQKQSFRYNKLFPLSDEAIRDHLLGKQTVGVYPLRQDDTCWFVAVDFDKKSWETDASAFLRMCRDMEVPASLERSRSGNGAHVWIFFSIPIQAALARKFASAVLTRTMERRYALGLDSYDRLFPSQDTMPKGGFGNLIALPLQHAPRERGNSVFVDEELRPYDDQWTFLSSIKRLDQDQIRTLLRKLYPVGDVLNIKYSTSDYDAESDPWILPPSGRLPHSDIAEPLPQTVSINLGNQIYIEKKGLPDVFLDQLIRLAAFQNPEFYKTQAMRLSTFGKPRVIACAEDLPRYIALPRGLLQEVLDQFRTQGITVEVTDHRFGGVPLQVEFHGERRSRQTEAAKALASCDDGILCAPTAFGKTAVAAQLIAVRKVNTLVLVHRRHLMDQWRERLALFLGLSTKDIGQIGSGKTKQTEKLDVAVIQSLIRKGEVKDIVSEYGQVIVDECHHVSAFSFERVLRKVKAKYVVGLTATPIRKDGHHPIILMQCGPIRFNASGKRQAAASAFRYEVVPRLTTFSIPPERNGLSIQDIYAALIRDDERNNLVVADVVHSIENKRFPLVLTERTDHLQLLLEKLQRLVPNVFVMKGGMGKKQRESLASEISSLPKDQQRVILATGRYVGEGFDDARLDTLFLAMPISWRGTVQQYVGRLHRLYENKQVVRVYDYVDTLVPVLNRMYEKRLKAYKAVGYAITTPGENQAQADLKFAAIERIAVQTAIGYEEARGCKVESVESDTRGFDLISRRTVSDTSRERIETRFIEVKGRAAVGEIALTANEYKTAQRLGDDYWLYVVFNCMSQPEVTLIQNPAQFDWEPLSKIDCYRIGAETLLNKVMAVGSK
ncbi:MAG TPA: DEAD/DEAH box helicase family protein [Pyrinomonadaceae bacterium]|nr:DEAD/DEAH box helicase family protein [Pyrinomonadaceae bacterium]